MGKRFSLPTLPHKEVTGETLEEGFFPRSQIKSPLRNKSPGSGNGSLCKSTASHRVCAPRCTSSSLWCTMMRQVQYWVAGSSRGRPGKAFVIPMVRLEKLHLGFSSRAKLLNGTCFGTSYIVRNVSTGPVR
jgi:hypothetical protein